MTEYVDNGSGIMVPRDKVIGIGRYDGEIIRDGVVIDRFVQENLVVYEGLNDMLTVYLGAGSQSSTWYLGIFQGNYTPVATDTAATISSNSTENSGYGTSVRPTWQYGSVSSQQISNSSTRASYTFNNTFTIYGAFLINNPTIGSTTGKLFSAARLGTAKNVVNLDQLLLTYTFTAASS